jgi:transposase
MSRTLTKKLALIKPGMLLVGIDLGKQKNVAVVIDQQARQLGRFSFEHNQEGYSYVVRQMEAICERVGVEEILVGMEPTGYFWKLVAAELERRGIKYRLVNAYTVKKHREGDQLDRAKDDNRDAFAIADLLRTGKFTETQRLTGVYAELREYQVTYYRLSQEMGRLKGLLDTAVGQCFPELRQLFKSLTGQTAQAMLRQHAAAQAVSRLSEAEFLVKVATDFSGKRLQRKKLRQAYQLAQASVGLADTAACQLSITCLLDELAFKAVQLATVKEELMTCFLSCPEAQYMLSLPLGDITTACILAEIGDPSRYSNAKQLVKLAGIQPSPNRSGQKTHSPTPMSGKGRPALRTALFYGCLHLIRTDPTFTAYYQHLKTRPQNPLTGLQAIGVLMGKVLHILWALIRQQTYYDPANWHLNYQ